MSRYIFGQSARFILSTMVIMSVVGVVMTILIHDLFYQSLAQELEERGVLLARYIAERNSDAILAEDGMELLDIREVLNRLVTETPTLSYAFIKGSNGRVLAHTFGEAFPSDLRNVNPVPPGSHSSARRLDTGAGIVRDVATPVVGPSSGEIHVGLSEEHIDRQVAGVTRILCLILGGAFLGSVGLISIVSGRISRPVKILTRAAGELGSGHLDTRVEINRDGELGVLAATFNQMAENLERSRDEMQVLNCELEEEVAERQRTEGALRENEERTRAFWDNAHTGIFVVDAESHRILDINQMALNLIGLSRDQVVGRECFRFVCPTEKNACPVTDLSQQVENSERHLLLADGSSLPIMKSVRLVNLGGQRHLIESFVDISELKRGQETIKATLREKEALLKEVHHRVKNNLQALSALLSLQVYYSGEGRTRSVLGDCQNRLRTMALIHQELYEAPDVANINFAAYIGRLSHSLMETLADSTVRIGLRIDVEKADLSVDTAIPAGLIVNELLTNALKHAFPNGRRGVVSILFRTIDTGTFQLKVEDNGVGLPPGFDVHDARSMGMQLVTILSEQLGGRLEVGEGPGARFTIVFHEYHEASTLVV